jgi:hypothetical protein
MNGQLRLGLIAAVAATLMESEGIAQSTRDSAGVRIVQNTQPLLTGEKAWRAEPRPLVDIGAMGGDSLYELNLVMGVAKLSDGRIAVANQGSNTIRFFDARGRFVGHAGRKGQGPGEFQQILGMWRLSGDTLAVGDLGEVEYFTAAGKHVRRGASRGTGDTYIYPGAFFPSGDYLGLDWNDFDRNAPATNTVSTLSLVRVSATGARADTLGRFPARVGSPMTQVHFAPQGQVAISGRRIWYGFSQRYEILRLNSAGAVETIIRRDVAALPVTESIKEEFRQFVLNGTGEDGRPWPAAARPRLEASLARARFAERLPVTSTLRGDANGNLWIRNYDYREAFRQSGPVRVLTIRVPSRWDVFNDRGTWLCTVELPASFTPLDIGADYIAGLWRDDDEVEHVRVYRLSKP